MVSEVTLFCLLTPRSLILCHSKTSDDCPGPEEREAGEGWEGAGGWGPEGWASEGGRKGDWDQSYWRKIQGGAVDGGFQAPTQPPVQPGAVQPGDDRAPQERKSSRRIFSIKVEWSPAHGCTTRSTRVYNTQRIIFLFTSALV